VTKLTDLIQSMSDLDSAVREKSAELEGSLLMASLMLESGRRARERGITFGEWLEQVEAMLQEHTR